MGINEQRQLLHQYLDKANDSEVSELYTMLLPNNAIQPVFTAAEVAGFYKRREFFLNTNQ